MELTDGIFLTKFGSTIDRERILNFAPWLFDQTLFSIVQGQDFSKYVFNQVPFWIRILNVPIKNMDRQLDMEVGGTVGKVVVIDWRDKDGVWVELMRVRVQLDITKPLRRIVKAEGKNGRELLCFI